MSLNFVFGCVFNPVLNVNKKIVNKCPLLMSQLLDPLREKLNTPVFHWLFSRVDLLFLENYLLIFGA
jgi:hypothetical protein